MLKKILSLFDNGRCADAPQDDQNMQTSDKKNFVDGVSRSSSIYNSSNKTDDSTELNSATLKSTSIDHKKISPNALTVITGLQNKGYSAYLVGGGVRDLLLELSPKDFDVATNATPEQIKHVFRNARIIGRRFKIVHVQYGREIIEVTTFRANHNNKKDQAKNNNTKNHSQQSKKSDKGLLLRDNVYGDLKSDAFRRDFTVNALYYDPTNQKIIDYTDGLADLKQRTLRIIGKAEIRYTEDPVRLLRAIRFSAKLGFKLEKKTESPIRQQSALLAEIPPARLFDESLKLLLSGNATATMQLLYDYNLLDFLFPAAADTLNNGNEFEKKFIECATINTDKRIRQRKRVTPAFIIAAFLWPALKRNQNIRIETNSSNNPYDALQHAADDIISQQLTSTAIPKRFLFPMRDIWTLQNRFLKRETKKAYGLLQHKRFRAAYDFVLLREQAGEDLDGLGHWWTLFQDEDENGKKTLLQQVNTRHKKHHRRSRQKTDDIPKP